MTFVYGIGPPIEQIREDNLPLLADEIASRDIVSLIDEVLRLRSELEAREDRGAVEPREES